jgi:hypothetical protein
LPGKPFEGFFPQFQNSLFLLVFPLLAGTGFKRKTLWTGLDGNRPGMDRFGQGIGPAKRSETGKEKKDWIVLIDSRLGFFPFGQNSWKTLRRRMTFKQGFARKPFNLSFWAVQKGREKAAKPTFPIPKNRWLGLSRKPKTRLHPWHATEGNSPRYFHNPLIV